MVLWKWSNAAASEPDVLPPAGQMQMQLPVSQCIQSTVNNASFHPEMAVAYAGRRSVRRSGPSDRAPMIRYIAVVYIYKGTFGPLVPRPNV